MTESKNVEFKHFNTARTCDNLINKLHSDRVSKCLLAFPNLSGGGDMILGIQEDKGTGKNIVQGQVLTETDQVKFEQALETFFSQNMDGVSRIWGTECHIPQKDTDWSCDFISVDNCPQKNCTTKGCTSCPHDEHRVLIRINVNHFVGGVFEKYPECYSLDDAGFVTKMSFEEWTKRLRKKPSKVPSTSSVASTAQGQTVVASSSAKGSSVQRKKSQKVKYKRNVALSFKENSSQINQSKHYLPGTEELADVAGSLDIFKKAYPVHFTPERTQLLKLSNDDIMADIENVSTEESFAFASDSLAEDFDHDLDTSAWTTQASNKPPHHTLMF